METEQGWKSEPGNADRDPQRGDSMNRLARYAGARDADTALFERYPSNFVPLYNNQV